MKQEHVNWAAIIAAIAGLVTAITALVAQLQAGKLQHTVNRRIESRIQSNSVAIVGQQAGLDYIGGTDVVATALASEPANAAVKIEQANKSVIEGVTK